MTNPPERQRLHEHGPGRRPARSGDRRADRRSLRAGRERARDRSRPADRPRRLRRGRLPFHRHLHDLGPGPGRGDGGPVLRAGGDRRGLHRRDRVRSGRRFPLHVDPCPGLPADGASPRRDSRAARGDDLRAGRDLVPRDDAEVRRHQQHRRHDDAVRLPGRRLHPAAGPVRLRERRLPRRPVERGPDAASTSRRTGRATTTGASTAPTASSRSAPASHRRRASRSAATASTTTATA